MANGITPPGAGVGEGQRYPSSESWRVILSLRLSPQQRRPNLAEPGDQ
jgi:hypothetical protein